MEKNPCAGINNILIAACWIREELVLSLEMLGLLFWSQIFCYGVFC